MIALITFFLVVVASLIVTRVATVVLTLTGMSRETARFQARSALSGVGFTTSEAEQVVSHPIRRRVVMFLMLLGSAGIVTAVATLSVSFVGQDADTGGSRLVILLVGSLLLLLAARSRTLDRLMTRFFGFLLTRFTDLDVRDYAGLLHLGDGHSVLEVALDDDAWLCGAPLGELQLMSEGVAVLGVVHPDGSYTSTPRATSRLTPGDTAVVYGVHDAIVALCGRPVGPEGDRRHLDAVRAHEERQA